jgi:CheY-like chemotaxis protein
VIAYTPDIIFMDNWLPDVGGIDATRALKRHGTLKNIPVIYFSANNDVESLAQQAGADGFLSKPFDIQELEDIISKHLRT